MRIEIVEDCEHGFAEPCGRKLYLKDADTNLDLGRCPGGSRREASEFELLTLVADLAEKVWWCEVHRAELLSTDHDTGEQFCWKQHMNFLPSAVPYGPCRMAERLLLPVGVLVDGPKEGT